MYDMNGNRISSNRYIRKDKEVIVNDSAYEELICDYEFIYESNVS
jgi:hypothetical protein